MTLPRFELHRPRSLEEVDELLGRYGDDAALYGGGTELLLLMKLGLAQPAHLIDVKRLPELRGLDAEDGVLRIGAAVTHRELERDPAVRARWPALARMERGIANVRVRAAGTLGGNLCFADPHSDPATFLFATGAELVARSSGGERRIPIADFVVGPYQTALGVREVLAEIRVPEPPAGAGVAHARLAFHERPAATVTCLVRVEDGSVGEARLAVGSVGVVPVRAAEAERLLAGLEAASPDADALAAAGSAAAEVARPTEDANGSVEYKRELVSVFVRRAFRAAVADA